MDKRLVNTSPATGMMQHGLLQYSLVVQPGAELSEKVVSEKQWLYEQFRQKPPTDQQPHITLASFQAREDMEETIIRYMHRICSQQQGFQVALNNYSGYPPHTIYLRVQDHHPFRQLVSQLQIINNYISSCACPPVKLFANPQLSFASKLPEAIYLRALMEYAQKTFHETFLAKELVLLRRRNNYETPKAVNIFRLQPGQQVLVN